MKNVKNNFEQFRRVEIDPTKVKIMQRKIYNGKVKFANL